MSQSVLHWKLIFPLLISQAFLRLSDLWTWLSNKGHRISLHISDIDLNLACLPSQSCLSLTLYVWYIFIFFNKWKPIISNLLIYLLLSRCSSSLSNDNKLSQGLKETGCLQCRSNTGCHLTIACNYGSASTHSFPLHNNHVVIKSVRLVRSGQKSMQDNLTTPTMHVL